MFKDVTDDELLYLIRSDNAEARNYLIERYTKRIYGMIDKFRTRNGIKELDYEECFSICMISFLNCIENYENGYNFAHYVSTSVEHALIKYWKDEQKRNTFYSLEDDVNDGMLYHNDCVSDGGITYYDDNLKKFLDKNLNEKEQLIVAYLLKGYNGPEIAKLVNLPYKKYSRKIDKIRELINKNFDF